MERNLSCFFLEGRHQFQFVLAFHGFLYFIYLYVWVLYLYFQRTVFETCGQIWLSNALVLCDFC